MGIYFLTRICFLCVIANNVIIGRCPKELSTCLRYGGLYAGDLHSSINRCNESGWKLLEIKSQEMQTFVEHFIRNLSISSTFFINLIRKDLGFDNFESVQNKSRKSFGVASSNNSKGSTLRSFFGKFVSQIPVSKGLKSVCKYQNHYNCVNCTNHNGKYYEIVNKQLTWYEARIYCIKNEGDLMDYEDYMSLVNSTSFEHLIGSDEYHLGNSRIRWVWSDDHDNFAQYANWFNGFDGSSYDDTKKCALVNITNNFKWEAIECNSTAEKAVICMRNISAKEDHERKQNILIHNYWPSVPALAIIFILIYGVTVISRKIMNYSRGKNQLVSFRESSEDSAALGNRDLAGTTDSESSPKLSSLVKEDQYFQITNESVYCLAKSIG